MKKTFWSDAAKAGGIIGLVYLAIYFIDGAFELWGASGAIAISSFVALAGLTYYFTKGRASKASAMDGFTYNESLGYIMAMMLFAGVVFGLGSIPLYINISPEYYREMLEKGYENNAFLMQFNEDMREQMQTMAYGFIKSPIYIFFSNFIGVIFLGLAAGLIMSIFTRKKADIFAKNN